MVGQKGLRSGREAEPAGTGDKSELSGQSEHGRVPSEHRDHSMLGDKRMDSSKVGLASMSSPSCSPGPSCSYWAKGKSKGAPCHHTSHRWASSTAFLPWPHSGLTDTGPTALIVTRTALQAWARVHPHHLTIHSPVDNPVVAQERAISALSRGPGCPAHPHPSVRHRGVREYVLPAPHWPHTCTMKQHNFTGHMDTY